MWSLLLASAALAYSAVRSAAWSAVDTSVMGFLVGCAASLHWLKRPRRVRPPRCPGWIRWPLLLLAAYAAFQLVPLPLGVLDGISPARASMVRAADAVLPTPVTFSSVSLAPAAGLQRLITLVACIVLVFLIRELAWQHGRWRLVAPVIAIALAEAVFSMIQSYYLGAGEARGTWANRNHFANFEGMCLPLVAAFIMSAWQWRRRGWTGSRSFVAIWLASCAAVVMLLAIIQSLSRMGFTAAILSIAVAAVMLAAANFNQWRQSAHVRMVAITSVFFTVLLAAFLLAPPELILRFAKVEFSDGIRTQDRLLLWEESRALISAYPVFGTGLGGYESGFLKYKVTFPLVRDAFAHNDYLQYLIELGALGFALAAISAAAILSRTVKLFVRSRGEERILSAACCGAFAAILLHSTVDFNLYIPANALLLAWLAGIACSLGFHGAQSGLIIPPRVALDRIANRTVHYDAITRMTRA